MTMREPVTVYLAGPIDDVSIEEANAWRDQIADIYPDVFFYNPATAYPNVSKELIPAVERHNRMAICLCDGLLANLAGSGRGFGTIREIEYASQNPHSNKPVAVAGEIASLMQADLMVAPTLEEAMELLLTRIAEGRHAQSIHPLAQLFSKMEED